MGLVNVFAYVLVLFIILLAIRSRKVRIPQMISHWHHLTENLQESSKDFYTSIEGAVASRNLKEIKLSRVNFHEGGFLSAEREYLRVIRREQIFDICAAPYGNGFFISWWFGEELDWRLRIISAIPFLGPWLVSVFKPLTYYRLDTALMFQESIRKAILEVLGERTQAKGLQSLSENESKPIMMDFFAKMR